MPELPEVETVKRLLEKVLTGKTIKEVIVRYRPIVSSDIHFEQHVNNQKIQGFDRKGKYLVFLLSDMSLVSHLRMEGKYEYRPSHDHFTKHEHVIFRLDDGHDLVYQDTRKFGRFEIKDRHDYLNVLPLSNVANEPFYMELDTFYAKLKKKSITIKDALLDQHIIAGIGNIYANEILFRSRIHPGTKASFITYEKAKSILSSSIAVLNKAIEEGGTTIDTFEVAPGIHGRFQNYLHVHGKKNEPCHICQTPIIKYQLSGRGTYFCPVCQPAYIIGLTGGIATGKTTVAAYLKEKGYLVIDNDKIVHDLYQVPEHIKAITTMFDLPQTNQIDKKALAAVIFKNEAVRKQLTDYIHPLVLKQIEDIKKQSSNPVIFIDMPLLFEIGYQNKVDLTMTVVTSQEKQVQRLMQRSHLTKAEALLRIKAQMPLEQKEDLSDIVLNNEQTKETLYEQIDAILKERCL